MDIDNTEIRERNISYLNARDPSILAWNRHGLENVRIDLRDKLSDDVSAEQKETTDTHVQVYLRIKSGIPFKNLYVIQSNTLKCKIPEGSHALRNMKDGESVTKNYSFSKIFGPETTQIDVFNYVVKPKMLDFINGRNSTLLTYGASGSGKTFTIVGTDEEPGVIPRALEYLFRTLPQLSERPSVKALPSGDVIRLDESACREEINVRNNLLQASTTLLDRTHHIRTYKAMQQRLSNEPAAILNDVSNVSLGIWVSFVEIYNEHIYDLLQPEPPRGKQRPKLRLANSGGTIHVKNLKTVNVTSGLEAFQILQYGIHNLNYAATTINSHSSRSHSIFTIRLAQASDTEEGTSVTHFNFCDLAGSERLKKTMNVGDRLKESNNINTSLLVLGRCISAVRNSQKQSDNKLVPFRESKLTQLFQKALSGFENIAMIVNMNPSQEMFDESHHVLNFSAIAKDIIVEQPKIIKPRKNNRFSKYMQNKQKESLHPIAEDAQENEIDHLRNIISQLVSGMEQQKLEFEQTGEMERNRIINGYKEILEDTHKYWQERMKKHDENLKAEYDMKLCEMKYQYETQLKKNAKRIRRDDSSDEDDSFTGRERKLQPIETINLDDSSFEEGDSFTVQIQEHKKTIKLQQQTITELQQELTRHKFQSKVELDELQEKVKSITNEKSLLQEKVKSITDEKSLLSIKVTELEKTLQDAEVTYNEIEEIAKLEQDKNTELSGIVIDLREKNCDLEYQLAQQITLKTNALDKLENYRNRYFALIEKGNINSESRISRSDISMSSKSSIFENKENCPSLNIMDTVSGNINSENRISHSDISMSSKSSIFENKENCPSLNIMDTVSGNINAENQISPSNISMSSKSSICENKENSLPQT